MDINQVYKAPSIPKLSKKNISSSVLRGATATTATPKLKTTKFSFLKPKISAETLKTDVSSLQVSESLSETNRILVEIQKQLALDFANRIAEEKELIKGIKQAESKRKFASKEKSVEATKKRSGARGGASTTGGAIGKVTAPIKSVFDKIKEFFTLILTGIVLNAAFKWLQDDKNKQLLFTIFDWIGKAFVPAVIAIVGYKLFRLLRGIFQIGKWLLKLPGRLSSIFNRIISPTKPFVPRTRSGPGPGLKPGPKNPALQQAKGAPPKLQPPLKTPLQYPSGKPIPQNPLRGATPAQAPGIKPSDAIKNLDKIPKTPGWLTKLAPALNFVGKTMRAIGAGMLFLEVKSDLENGDIKAAAVKLSAFGLGWLAAWLIGGSGLIATPVSGGGSLALLGLAAGAQIGTEYGIRRAFGYNQGGTVPGPKVNKDVTPVLATPGEEVIRTASAMLFRPLLKDLNNNAGRIWNLFSQAITKVINVTAIQKEVSDNFNRIIKDFDKYLKDDIAKKRGGGGGGFRVPSTKPRSISAAPRSTNVIMNAPSGSGGMTFLPMVLPKQSSKPPQIPQMQGKATEVPVISPVNFANPWMDVTPELYGIQLYG